MYFDNFPKILYDFDLTPDSQEYAVSGPTFQLVKDITKNIRFKKEFMDQIGFYEIYRLGDGETLDRVSEKLYGTPHYHWMLMLLNQRYDYIEDYPIEGSELDALVKDKYGDRGDDAHHYTDANINTVNPTVTLTITDPVDPNNVSKTLFDNLQVGCVVIRKTAIGNYVGRVESFNKTTKTIGVYIANGDFNVNDPIQIYKYYDDANGNFVEELLGTPIVKASELPAGIAVVTNYEYEYYLNEKKRLIRVVPQQYVQQIINEFEKIFD